MMLTASSAHADRVAAAQVLAVKQGSKLWGQTDPRNIASSWRVNQRQLVAALTAIQLDVAADSSAYGADVLAEQGVYSPPQAFVNPRGFAGIAPDGRTLEGLLWSPVVTSKAAIGQGVPVPEAMERGQRGLSQILRTVVADTGRSAAQADVATREHVGYTRVVVGKSCPDCLILAGRFYMWNAGFQRHPGCDCQHVQTTKNLADNQFTDPYAHFESMSTEEQDEFWGEGNAQAIRDGGDIYQVYNSRRGISKDRLTTLEGTTRRGHMGGMDRRLTPDGIYKQAKSRDEALKLLQDNGYLLPGGQQAGGVLRGNDVGFAGYMGHGGQRRGATQAFQEAVRTGRRDPRNVATMTAAERRMFDAQLKWDAVVAGRNPYGGPLTPDVAASVEKDYRRWLRTGGNIF